MIKRAILALFLATYLFLGTFGNVYAANTWQNQDFPAWYGKVYDPSNQQEIFGERYTAAQVQWIYYSLISMFLNFAAGNNTEAVQCVLTKLNDLGACASAVQTTIQGLSGLTYTGTNSETPNTGGNILVTITSNPLSGTTFLGRLLTKQNIIPIADAQNGYGFDQITPVEGLWKATRNFSYGFMVIAIIVLSFMVMFRIKTSPQTMITVQTALPKILVALLLITASYAIAGLVMDLMYVATGIIALLITSAGASTYTAIGLFDFMTLNAHAIGLLLWYWFMFMLISITSIFGNALAGIIMFFVAFFAIIVLLYNSVKIVIMFLKNYAMIMITIITGPLEILAGTVVNGMGFGSWFRKLVSYLAVYPVANLLFFLAFFFLAHGMPATFSQLIGANAFGLFPYKPTAGAIGGNTWFPPLSDFALANDNIAWLIVSYAIINVIPNTAQIVQSFISGRAFDFESAVGQSTRQADPYANIGKTYLGREAMTGAVQRFGGGRLGPILTRLESILEMTKIIPPIPRP